MASKSTLKSVETLTHGQATRKNIPTAEYQSVIQQGQEHPVRVAYERRNRDLDPQLVWRGKDEQDWSDLVVNAPPLYIQEKVHPKVLIDDLLRHTRAGAQPVEQQLDLFADFNGIPEGADRTDFYQHDQNWSNRMILGDSLQVMASLAEREGLRGKVQCIYVDPPYGIKFNSNFQWSTTSREAMDGNVAHITREPEQVKAYRDTWRDGIHSYLTYLRDRLTVARDLLSSTGAIFVQISDENVHRVRALLDEVFGEDCFITEILVKKKGSQISGTLDAVNDFILCYGRKPKHEAQLKFRPLLVTREDEELFDDFPLVELESGERMRIGDLEQRDGESYQGNSARFRERYRSARLFALNPLKSGGYRRNQTREFHFRGRVFPIRQDQCWKHTVVSDDEGKTPGMNRLGMADRLYPLANDVRFIRYASTPSVKRISNWWDGLGGASSPIYVVQTNAEVVKRCVLMVTDPGDLVLDPTCGSGTTAYVAEQWGRRWITIDTSRVALALARARIMGARYPYYLLADSREGQLKEAEVTHTAPASQSVHGSIRQGFVYERVRSSTSGSIANNAEIDVIWDKWQATLEPLREALNAAVNKEWQEWEIPREADGSWPEPAKKLHADWWQSRIARQKEIDASIAAKADFEYLYDRPYEDRKKVRVAGPFTVESLSPHRVLGVDEDGELIDAIAENGPGYDARQTFPQMVLENLRTAGVQQAHREDRITFTALTPWPGELVCAEGRYLEGSSQEPSPPAGGRGQGETEGVEKRAAIFIGPEFGTVTRPDLVQAAREAADAGFDVLIACAFNYEAHAAEFTKLGRIPVLKARMNADLHMADDLKNTGKGNLFVIFGEPDIDILDAQGNSLKAREAGRETYRVPDGSQLRVRVNGVDVFHPDTGEVRSDGPEGIACWFIDTDYNEESFFVRHAYFLGANDPYTALKTTLKAEIDEEAWATLNSDTSRPFLKPTSGRIAVKVINHLGDEAMRVFRIN
jgi:adenine-specific DNA-methyltransferase